MNGPAPDPSDPRPLPRLSDDAYDRMALILRIGLIASLAVFAGAIGVYVTRHSGAVWNGAEPNPSAGFLNLAGLARGLAAGSPVAFLTLGVLLLVSTPLARVLSGLYYFHRDGERTIAAIALTVFVLLVFGLLVLGPIVR